MVNKKLKKLNNYGVLFQSPGALILPLWQEVSFNYKPKFSNFFLKMKIELGEYMETENKRIRRTICKNI
jgi:hypothetical protein